jgi:hypothetical protein
MRKLNVLTAIAVTGVFLATAATPSEAAKRGRSSAYDGLWSVSIRTEAGPCDPSYRYPARIIGGLIRQADNDFSYQISGAVAKSGGIAVTVSKGGQSATGYGRLRGTSGGGRWTAGSNACYGTWSAMKRASN